MSLRKLTKHEALEYLTPVIDGEVSEEERLSFLAYLETDEEMKRYYLSHKRIKKLISSRYPFPKAPENLCRSVRSYLESRRDRDDEADDLNIDHRCQPVNRISPAETKQPASRSLWRMLGGFSLLLLIALWNMLLPGE